MEKEPFKRDMRDRLRRLNARLDDRYRARREDLRERRAVRRQHLQRRADRDRWPLRLLRLLLYIGTIVLIYQTYVTASAMYQNYQDTLRWTRDDRPRTASVPTDMLYLSDSEQKAHLDYIKARDAIWDVKHRRFRPGVTKAAVRELDALYQKIEVGRETAGTHDVIMTLSAAYLGLPDILTDGTVPRDVKTSQVAAYINRNRDDVRRVLLDDETNSQAKTLYTTLVRLGEDLLAVEATFSRATGLIGYEGRTFTVGRDIMPDDLDSTLPDTHYRWAALTDGVSVLFKEASPAAESHLARLRRHARYTADQNDRQAFMAYMDDYKAAERALRTGQTDLPDFTGKPLSEVTTFAGKHDLDLTVRYRSDPGRPDVVLSQTPDTDRYKRIFRGADLTVTVSKRPAPTTEEPTTEEPTTEEPETDEPETDEPTTEDRTTETPTTEAPETETPETEAQTTERPTTEERTTEQPDADR